MRVQYHIVVACAASLLLLTGCKKYLDIPLPANQIAGDGAYASDRSSAATISNIYANLSSNGYFDGTGSIGYKTGLYADELQNLLNANSSNQAYYTNVVTGLNETGPLWTYLYKQLYYDNLAIEGISASTTLLNKNQWLGEAYFVRGFLHFYLTALYGDVMIATTSDFQVNKLLARMPKADVYKQIIADLKQAQQLLTNEYKDALGTVTTNRGRPNKHTATALLARVYLYNGEWANAEAQADAVINGVIGSTPAYRLLPSADLDKVFLAASAETIFALAPTGTNYERDFGAYNNNMPNPITDATKTFTSYVNAALTDTQVGAFEKNVITQSNDLRKTNWVREVTRPATQTTPAQTLYFPYKYKSSVPGAEYIVLFRLAEQYLVRAEARARQNNTDGAKADLTIIRSRAGLTDAASGTPDALVTAVLQERRVELFSEQGHRLLDLRRTGTLDAVMKIAVTTKGTNIKWTTEKQYWPIPPDDVRNNPALIQTPGYQ